MAHLGPRVSLGSDSWDLSLDLWDFCNSDALSAVVFGKGALSFQRAARETACAMDAGLASFAYFPHETNLEPCRKVSNGFEDFCSKPFNSMLCSAHSSSSP